MFGRADDILRDYITRVPCFSPHDYRIVCINNSCASGSDARPVWQGVLHAAAIPEPNGSASRVINSTMIASVPAGTADTVDPAAVAHVPGPLVQPGDAFAAGQLDVSHRNS
mgnify:CR=1 FL=1